MTQIESAALLLQHNTMEYQPQAQFSGMMPL
jgi:hypothetical protein